MATSSPHSAGECSSSGCIAQIEVADCVVSGMRDTHTSDVRRRAVEAHANALKPAKARGIARVELLRAGP